MVAVKIRLLSATTRPFESNMRPRSGNRRIVRVRTASTTDSLSSACTACINHIRADKVLNKTPATIASAVNLRERLLIAIPINQQANL